MVVMGPRGRSSILVVGPVDVRGPSSTFCDRGGGSSFDGRGEKRGVTTCDIAFVTSPN
jgi:hypothetical protein